LNAVFGILVKFYSNSPYFREKRVNLSQRCISFSNS